MKMEVKLSPEEVEKIVEKYLSQKFKSVGEIKASVGQQLVGHYTNEHYEAVFKGFTCEVETE